MSRLEKIRILNSLALAAVSRRNPDIRIFALETVISRFSDVMWVMQQVLFMSMDKRLAIFLSDESARTGKRHKRNEVRENGSIRKKVFFK